MRVSPLILGQGWWTPAKDSHGNPASTLPHQAADRLNLRHETVLPVMNVSLPLFANRLLLDDR